MSDYKKFFSQILNEDLEPTMVSPESSEKQDISDSEHFKQMNQKMYDQGLEGEFEVKDAPSTAQMYLRMINKWGNSIQKTQKELRKMYDFAAKKADEPGGQMLFGTVSTPLEKMITDFGTILGDFETLGIRIQRAIKSENDKQANSGGQ